MLARRTLLAELADDIVDLVVAQIIDGRHGQRNLLHFLGAQVLEHFHRLGLPQAEQQNRTAVNAVITHRSLSIP
jgi:hypothetical protein